MSNTLSLLLLMILVVPPPAKPAKRILISVAGGYNMIFLPAGVAQRKGFFRDAYASYDATVKVISADGSIPEDGLKLLIDQARKDSKVSREVTLNDIAGFGLLREIGKR